jgi:putative membrane protein
MPTPVLYRSREDGSKSAGVHATMPAVGDAAFFGDGARTRVTEAVADVESRTAAEIVVVVRHASGAWREVDLAVGAAVAFGVLLLLLFHPKPIAVEIMPVDVALAFLGGAVLCAGLPPLKRALLPRKRAGEQVRSAARAAFVDQGVSRTQRRTGILVYVSTFERRVEVVADVGVDAKLIDAPVRALSESVAAGPELDAFLAALRSLGPALAGSLPRRADDVNELPDAPVMA